MACSAYFLPTKYPRIYGTGMPNFLGCQIYCDTGFLSNLLWPSSALVPYTVNFRLLVQKRNIEFQFDQSRSARLPNSLNAIGQFKFQYCVMWTTNLKFTVLQVGCPKTQYWISNWRIKTVQLAKCDWSIHISVLRYVDNQPEIYGTASDKRWGEKAS